MNRNIIHTLWMTATLPLLLASCQQEELPGMNGASDTTPLSITVTDGGYALTTSADGSQKAATRATEDGYRTEFTASDACGLYLVRNGAIVYDNVKLTATAGTNGSLIWQPEAGVTLAGGMAGEHYFLYYPYRANMTDKVTASATSDEEFFAPLISGWQPAADQSTYAAYTASDLMTATGTAVRTNGSISLSFSMTHRMAMAVIEMPKTVYKFNDNSIPDYVIATTADFGDNAKPCRMADGTYRYIVNSASGTATNITGSYDGDKKEFTITPSGISANFCKTYKVDGATISEKQTTLQMGDYFCKNSDDNWYIIPQEATPDGNVIGIVFYAGQHETDQSNYLQPLTEDGPTIPDGKVHGYVVALTDVHDDSSDRLRWEYGPGNVYNKAIDASTSTRDWQGYSNSLKFHEFVNKNENKEAGWEMKHFPAALACETYGNRMLDKDGNDANGKYDWQKPLAAPGNTSGWFLPSYGQLQYLYKNRSVLSARMTEVKNSTPNNYSYKNHIKWVSTSLYYWSSTENSDYSDRAWYVYFYYGYGFGDSKRYAYCVRAVLAF